MRLANNNDVLSLCSLRIEQQKDDWKDEYEDKYDLYNRTKDYLEKHLNNELFIFLEECENKIIATCGLQIIEYLPQCNDNGKQGYLCNVYTDKDYRNKGIQTSLLKEVIEFAKEKNICELNLSADDMIAIKLYKKFGFELDNLMMKLDISK